MKTRIISAIIAIPLLLFFIIYGGLPLRIVTAILSLIGMYELYKAVSGKIKSVHLAGFILEILYSYCAMFALRADNGIVAYSGVYYILIFAAALIVITLAVLLILVLDHKRCNINDASISLFGFFYVGVLLNLICFIRDADMFYVWLPFIFAFVSDTGAYFTGSFIGKHKLTPELSPKKTVEGSVGGVIAAALFTAVYTVLFNKFGNTNHSVVIFTISGIIGAILSQFGDLAASSIKRYTGIKDYGNLMPGHGGVLDRFDSVIFTTPLVFALIVLASIG